MILSELFYALSRNALLEGANPAYALKCIFVYGVDDSIIQKLGLEETGFKLCNVHQTQYLLKRLASPEEQQYSALRSGAWKESRMGIVVDVTGVKYDIIQHLMYKLQREHYETMMLYGGEYGDKFKHLFGHNFVKIHDVPDVLPLVTSFLQRTNVYHPTHISPLNALRLA